MEHSSSKNININEEGGYEGGERTPFYIACRYGHTDVVKLMLDHAVSKSIDSYAKSRYGCTPLMQACFDGHFDVVKILLNHPNSQHIKMNA